MEIELNTDEVGDSPIEDKPKVESVEEEGAGVVGTLEVAGNDFVLTASKEGVSEEKENKTRQTKALATPVARAMAKEMGIDINLVRGTGPAQRVMKEDILNHAKQDTKTPIPQPSSPNNLLEDRLEIEPLSQIRKTIAKNMIQSKHNAAHMTVFEEVEISELDRVRKKYKDYFKDENIRITYLAFIVKSVALALKKHKSLNAEMDMEKGVMIYKKYYNIGIAADTDKGLVVPVIRNADKLSVKELALEIQTLADKARDGKLSMDDMKDGTFTITSYGSIGGLFAVPVINYPQAGILGIGRISKQPIVKDDKLDIGLMLPLSLSVDHRIADGGETSRFLNRVMSYLNEPVGLLID